MFNKKTSKTLLNLESEVQPTSENREKINFEQLAALLQQVAFGKLDEAVASLNNNPQLALLAGNLIDCAGRCFEQITAFQYAIWALDYPMLIMIKNYLPDIEANKQILELKNATWIQLHGKQANWQKLIDALREYRDNCSAWNSNRANNFWCHHVGGAQLALPAHVIRKHYYPYGLLNQAQYGNNPESTVNNSEIYCWQENLNQKLGYDFAWLSFEGLGIAKETNPDILYDYQRISRDINALYLLLKNSIEQVNQIISNITINNPNYKPRKRHRKRKPSNKPGPLELLIAHHILCKQLDIVPIESVNRIFINNLLRQSLQSKDFKKCSLLLNLGADIEQPDVVSNNTLLHTTIINNNNEAAQWLISKGASLEFCNSQGNNALILSVLHNNYQLIAFLLNTGANKKVKNLEGENPALIALLNKNTNILSVLVGSEIAALPPLHLALNINDNEMLIHILEKMTVNLEELDPEQVTALYVAVEKDNLEAASILLRQGADPNVRCGTKKLTPLHIAVVQQNTSMVVLLLQHPNIIIDTVATNGATPLHLAAESGKNDIFKLLLKAGANPTVSNIELLGQIMAGMKIVEQKIANVEQKQQSVPPPLVYMFSDIRHSRETQNNYTIYLKDQKIKRKRAFSACF